MRDLSESERYRHRSTRTLDLLAKRLGRVFASYANGERVIRERGWRRPRVRVYPSKPTVGIRATRPNEWWHIDVTTLRLRDGTRGYVHGSIDNYSRKLVGWAVKGEIRAETTRAMLLDARSHLASAATVKVMTDAGSENLSIGIPNIAEHVVAQVGVHFSNSMIEAFWRQLRHQRLYLHSLESIASLRELVAEYVADHNGLIPRVELVGRTPDEAHAGLEEDLEAHLAHTRRR